MLSKYSILAALGLEGCYLSGMHRFAKPYLGGVGAILTLHHVRPSHFSSFRPNQSTEITPEFLERTILHLRVSGFDIVGLDEAMRRIKAPGTCNPFVVLAFEHGYRDVFSHAYPVLKKHACPFTLYIPTAFPDGEGLLWWRALEHVIGTRDVVMINAEAEPRIYMTATLEEKYEAYYDLCWWLHSLDDKTLHKFMRDFCATFGFDMKTACRETCMSWPEIALLAADPLASIGVQTLGGTNLPKQIRDGARILEAALGKYPKHVSCTYGKPDADICKLGCDTAVTSSYGMLYAEHANHLHQLPRIPLRGDYQSLHCLDVLLSGLPSYIQNGFACMRIT